MLESVKCSKISNNEMSIIVMSLEPIKEKKIQSVLLLFK